MESNKTFVYLINKVNTNIYKIGTTNSIENRITILQTGNDTKLILTASFPTEYGFIMENSLHNFYRSFKLMNEWYDFSNSKNIKEEFLWKCELFEKNFKYLKQFNNHYFENLLKKYKL